MMSGLVPEVRKVRRRARPSSLARTRARDNASLARPLSGGREPDLLLSQRRVSEADAILVASQLGPAWRLLGLRLNFDPRTLDSILLTAAGNHLVSGSTMEEALYMLRLWSQLPTATIGRLATVLWEMGKHAIAMQLMP